MSSSRISTLSWPRQQIGWIKPVQALILIGHGALNKASGAAMIRHAAALRKAGLAPITGAGFLNYSRPSYAEAIERCLAKGATFITVQPYFLIDGYFVNTALRKLVEGSQKTYPEVTFQLTEAFGYHPALAELVIKRKLEVVPARSNEAILLMAHGTPQPEANQPLYQIAKRVQERTGLKVLLAFMECNEPGIMAGLGQLITQGYSCITAVPYFLQLGGHVREDLPRLIGNAKVKHPAVEINLVEHLAYDDRLLEVIRERFLPYSELAEKI